MTRAKLIDSIGQMVSQYLSETQATHDESCDIEEELIDQIEQSIAIHKDELLERLR